MAVVLVTLFTLVGELNRSLRTIVQLVDFTLLGYFFLKVYGLNFSNYKPVPKFIIYFIILYFSTLVITSSVSNYPFAGIKTILLQFVFFIIVYVFFSLIKDTKDIRNYFFSIVLVGCILVTISLISFISDGYSLINIISKDRTRVSAIITNFEVFTNFFVIAFPILISQILIKSEKRNNKIYLLLLVYISLGLFLTMSRSAILGIVFSTLIIFFMLRRKRFYQFICTMIFVVLLFILSPPLNEFIRLLFRIEEGMSARDYLWTMSIDIIKGNPIFGLGPGAYKYELFNYYPFMLNEFYGKVFIYYIEVAEGVNLAHNLILVFFTEMGILGLITVLALPIIYFRIGLMTIKKYKSGPKDKYYSVIGLFAAGASIIFRNLFNSIGLIYIGGVHSDLPFWLILSSLVYYYQAPINTDNNTDEKVSFPVLTK